MVCSVPKTGGNEYLPQPIDAEERPTSRQRSAAVKSPRTNPRRLGEARRSDERRVEAEAVVTRDDLRLDTRAGIGVSARNRGTGRWGQARREIGDDASRPKASRHPVRAQLRHFSSTPLLVAFLGRGVGETDALFRKAMRVELGRNPGQVPRGHENRSEESRVAFLIAGRILTQARQL